MTARRDAALGYRRRGWSVVPLRPGEKRPLAKWEPFQSRLATVDEIAAWFARWPDANVGIVTGAISGLVVIDVDPQHGGDDSLADLEAAQGPLSATVEAITGGGGRHLYFRHPGGVLRNRVGLAPGIDLRGDGGYIVAPPSRHPSGRDYVWEVSRHPDDVVLAALPAWAQAATAAHARAGHGVGHWRELTRDGVAQGQRNATIASLAGHLLWHEVDLAVVRELLLAWNRVRCRPPLADDEVARVVENIGRLHRERLRPIHGQLERGEETS